MTPPPTRLGPGARRIEPQQARLIAHGNLSGDQAVVAARPDLVGTGAATGRPAAAAGALAEPHVITEETVR